MEMMNDLLRNFLDWSILVLLDNILIYSTNIEEHTKHLRSVLQKLHEHQLYVKTFKCKWVKTLVEFLRQ